MDIFEYLPQLIVAYDGNDEFTNLIHVKKANGDNDYYCPCCGGIVKPRALDSNKEQSHYYHKTGKCTKESQLHFFCKNWLFEEGSKFYIECELFEVSSIEIEKSHYTPFGEYRPDITVYTTSGKIIYFEMFFSNRKTGDDYFCKWDALGNDVVEVNIKEYMFKTDTTTIPSFTYLYHNGVCYSKQYVKRDLYANTIARIKHELTRQKVLNYKARIEQLDWFWQKIISNSSREEILKSVSFMEYDDMVNCYEIIKRKQCVKYLKEDILNTINQKVISDVRKTLDLPYDENIYFDLKHVKGRTYEVGIRLKLKTEHINYDSVICGYNCWDTPIKIVFQKTILNLSEIIFSKQHILTLKNIYSKVILIKEKIINYESELLKLEDDGYKVRTQNERHTVLKYNNGIYEVFLQNCNISFDIYDLKEKINKKTIEINNKNFLNYLFSSKEYISFVNELKAYKNFDTRLEIKQYDTFSDNYISFKLYLFNKCFYCENLEPNINDFLFLRSECKDILLKFLDKYSLIICYVEKINNCKNKFWKASFSFNHSGYPVIYVDQNIFISKKWTTFEKITLPELWQLIMDEKDIIEELEKGMRRVLRNIEGYGYRLLEACD